MPDSLQPRILYVTPRFSPFIGGIETHTAEVASRLTLAGCQVSVLTTDPGHTLPATEEIGGVTVNRVRAWPANRDYGFAPQIYRYIRRHQAEWDLIHLQGYHTFVAPMTMLAAARSGVPFAVSFHSGGHSSRFRNAIRGTQRKLLRPLLERAEHLIAVSQFEAALFRQHLGLPHERFTVVPNGLYLPDVSSETDIRTEPGLIISIGRLERYKGHHRAINAMPAVLRKRPDARLLILGSGPYEHELRNLVRQRDLDRHVEITSIPGSDRVGLARQLACANLVTLLSDYEAHPIAMMEALAVRRQILVTHTSGLGELADLGCARSIPLGSSDNEVAAAIVESLEHAFVPQEIRWPSWDECADSLLALYQASKRAPQCAS